MTNPRLRSLYNRSPSLACARASVFIHPRTSIEREDLCVRSGLSPFLRAPPTSADRSVASRKIWLTRCRKQLDHFYHRRPGFHWNGSRSTQPPPRRMFVLSRIRGMDVVHRLKRDAFSGLRRRGVRVRRPPGRSCGATTPRAPLLRWRHVVYVGGLGDRTKGGHGAWKFLGVAANTYRYDKIITTRAPPRGWLRGPVVPSPPQQVRPRNLFLRYTNISRPCTVRAYVCVCVCGRS